MNRLALIQPDVDELLDILRQAEPHESGAFFLLREGRGYIGRRLLATDPILPGADAWERQHEGHLRPSARWISSVISKAVTAQAGLLFVHSHPDPRYPVGFSSIDRTSILSLADTIGPILEGPFAAAVVHPTGWAAAVVAGGEMEPVERITSVGRTLRMLSPIRAERSLLGGDLHGVDDRQQDALGTVHNILQHLDIAVVGVGGTGSPIAEQLVRMGAASITLLDRDLLDTPSNVRRVVGSRSRDLRLGEPPPKVDVVGQHLDDLEMAVPVHRIFEDVSHEHAFRHLLEADVVMCCTDNHGSRALVNDLASTYLLPVIDVGVQAGAKKNAGLAALVAEVCVLTATTPCLWCRKRISADVIRAENLPPEQRERLLQEGYLVGAAGAPAPSVVALTGLGAGLATCALLGLLSTEGDVCPSGYWVDGLMGDGSATEPTDPLPSCRCRQNLGVGDTKPPPFLPRVGINGA